MTNNEWGALKKVIVGRADGAKIPFLDLSLRAINYADLKDTSKIISGPYPAQVVDEANEDLDIFCSFLIKNNVEVLRPENIDPIYYNYCPRDNIISFKNVNIATPMPIRSRKNEWKANKYNLKNILDLTSDHLDSLYNLECIKNPNILSLNETAPAFDAANILRANDNLLFLVSNSGNIKGAELLQDVLGNKGKVKIVKDIYSYMHIDSTIAFLREGLMLLNPSRVKSKDQLPFPFNTWDAIWAPEPVDIGHYPNYCNSSKWVSINLLSINPNLVVLEEHQTNLRKELKKYNIDCAMLPMRHSRTLGGCFHCVTLDLKRDD